MPEFEVTWQMTGSTFIAADDEVGVLAVVDGMSEGDLIAVSSVQGTQVIATKDTS